MLRHALFATVAVVIAGCGGRETPGPSPDPGAGSSSGGYAGPQVPCESSLTNVNRETVTTALDALFVQKDVTAIDEYWADPYLQHNPVADSGVEAFRSFMAPYVTQASFSYSRLRTLADCDLVVVQGDYSGSGVIFDMFRVENGQLVEHWDSDANQASDAGGTTQVTDPVATEFNRERIQALYAQALIPRERSMAEEFFANSLVIRRAPERSGAAGFFDYLEAEQIRYQEVHHLVADGNFVFVLAEGSYDGNEYGFYDLFRLEDGLVVEHWDSRRPVPDSTASGLGIF